jgi:hypothetical protein
MIRKRRNDSTYTVQVQFGGKTYCRKTPATNARDARKHEADLKAALHAGQWALLDRVKLRQTADASTIAQLLACYETHAPLDQISPNTNRQNRHALLNILRRSLPNIDNHSHSPISTLNPAMVMAWKTAILQETVNLPPLDRAAKLRTANSILAQARSLFSQHILPLYTNAGIHIPESAITALTKTPPFQGAQKRHYSPPSDIIIAKTFAALPELERTDPNAYIAIWLAIAFALRKSEIAAAKPDWFITITGHPDPSAPPGALANTLVFLKGDVLAKNGQILEDIKCLEGSWQYLEPHVKAASAAGQPWLLRGTATERLEDTFRRISAWMRQQGWSTQKTIHEFRAWSGCQVAMQDGPFAARVHMRHAQFNTTDQFYGRYIHQKNTKARLIIPTIPEPQLIQQAS